MLITFMAQSVTGRALGVAGFGVFSYAYAWATIGGALAVLGFDAAVLRFASQYNSMRDLRRQDGLIRYAARFVAGTSLLFAIVVLLVALQHPEPTCQTLAIAALCIPPIAFLRIDSAHLRGMRRELSSLLPDRLLRESLLLAASTAVVASSSPDYGVHQAMWAFLAGTVASAAIAHGLRRRARYCAGPAGGGPIYDATLWFKTALGLGAASALETLFTRLDVIVLGSITSNDTVGIMAMLLLLSGLVILPTLAFNIVCVPRISALHHNHEHAGLATLSRIFGILNGACALLLALPLLLAPSTVLGLVGPDFATDEVADALVWMTLSRLITAPLGPVAPMLAMTGHERDLAWNYLIFTILKSSALLFAAARYGLAGAVLVSASTFVLLQLRAALLVRRRLGFFPGVTARPPR